MALARVNLEKAASQFPAVDRASLRIGRGMGDAGLAMLTEDLGV